MRRGRPKGSSITYEVAEEIPVSCPTCHNTDLKVVPGRAPNVAPYSGPMNYDRVVWRLKKCTNESCGQHVMVRTYEKINTQSISSRGTAAQ